MNATHYYCTYCDYYSRNYDGMPNELPVFTGTHTEVVEHAYAHPIGDPEDMAQPISDIGDRLEAILKGDKR